MGRLLITLRRPETKWPFINDSIRPFRNCQAMSPRPRKVTDDQLFAATHTAMTRLGPGELTLAEIARDAGVTAAVLVQRFGSKRNLLLTLSKRVAEGAGEMIATLAKQHQSPLAALRAYVDCMAGMAASPAAFARSLAYLQIDLTDPD